MFKRFLRSFKRRSVKPKPVRQLTRMRLVELEHRWVPATFVVNSTADTGIGSLRNQVIAANAAPGSDSITFDAAIFTSAKTITLSSGEIAITGDLSIIGPAQPLTISGNSSSRIFNVNNAVTGVAINVTIDSLTMTKGVTSGVNDGAAIFVQDENLALSNCSLTSNSSADAGGAVRVEAGGLLTIDSCTFSGNTAASIGGAVSIAASIPLTVNDSTFSSNTAGGGGAVNMFAGGSILISGTTFSGNTAATGNGGAVFFNGAMSSVSFRNDTFHNNSASGDGGAINFSSGFTGILAMHNSTVSSNQAGSDGGAFARTGGNGTISLVSTIVFSNQAGSANDNFFTTGTVNATLCCVTSSTGAAVFNGDAFTTANLGVNPGLGTLQNNGGPVQTRALNAGSIAIDAGSNALGLTTDQRGAGYFRVRGKATDIGAFETPDNFTVTNTNNSGAGSLRQAVLDANSAIGIDTVVFDTATFGTAKTITLTTGEVLITESVTIDGPAAALTISGNNTSRVFHIESAANVVQTFMNDLTLTAGKASGGDGGAIFATEPLFLTNVTVTNSSAGDEGGAIRIATPGSLTFDIGTISGSSAVTGGGLAIDPGVSASIRNVTFSNNVATGFGGGIAVLGSSPFTITNSTLSANTAASGGGAAWPLTSNNNGFNNSTLTGNVATGGKGGGAYIKAGTVSFTSSIVSGNSGAGGPDIFSTATTTAVNNCAVGNAIGFTLTGANNLAFGANLLLGALADNGGPTKTHVPAPNSPVLGKGSNATGASFDQRGTGFQRQRGSGVDIGAVEVGQFIVTNANASGAGSLLQASLDANAAGGADAITFDPTVFATAQSIIPSATLTLTGDTDIIGPDAKVTISGNLARRVITITGGTHFAFSNLSLALGSATGNGGALLDTAPGNSEIQFNNCNLSFNQATGRGGAVSGGLDHFAFTDCTLSNNDTTGIAQDGGAIALDNTGSVDLLRTTISNNQASGDGGAIATLGGSVVFVIDSTVSSNSAGGNGGGLYIDGAVGSSLVTIRNSTLSDNTSTLNGGGIGWENSSGTLRIQNATITNNTANIAAGGGGVSVGTGTGNLNIESSIISGNINSGAPDIDNPNTTSVKTSAVGDNLGWAKTDLGGNLPFQPHANLKLGSLTNNGGPTFTHLPQSGSPLIGAGSNPASLSVDQRGFPRSLSGAVDIGSAEVLNTVVKNTNDSGVDSLRQVILDTNAAPGPQTITFDSAFFATAKTIAITSGELLITDDLTISGPTSGVTLNAQGLSRVVKISSGFAGTVVVDAAFSRLTITGGNASDGDGGGGIFNRFESITLDDCIVTGNSVSVSGFGGGGIQSLGDATLRNTVISNNISVANGGGFAQQTVNANVTFINSSVSGNSASTTGGGLSTGNGFLTIIGTTVSGNSASASSSGGGGLNSAGDTVTIQNSTFSGNVSASDGGAIRFFGISSNSLTIQNSTIVGNTAGAGKQGGGISVATSTGTPLTIESSIIAGNSANSEISSPAATAKTSLLGSKAGIGTLTGDAFTNANIGVDPQLGPLQNNGGSTRTHLPAFTSPAVNNGSNPAALTTDQRGAGFARIFGGAIDIGAAETHTFNVTNTNNSGAGSLRQAVLDANALPGADGILFDPTLFTTAKTITLTTGQLLLTDAVSIFGPASRVTVNANALSRVIDIDIPASMEFAFSNLIITGGRTTGPSNDDGAGLRGDVGAHITLTNCTLVNNTGAGTFSRGGGLANFGSGCSTTLVDCVVQGNSASGFAGGIGGNALSVIRTTIANNLSSASGGGILGFDGMSIVDSSIVNNSAATSAGGVLLDAAGTLQISNTTISGNSATVGGGIGLGGPTSAGFSGTLVLQNTTITANSATTGGGIAESNSSGFIVLESTIVYGNSSNGVAEISANFVDATKCLIGSKSGIGSLTADSFTFAKLGANPLLGPLANNGGPTLTHLPAVNSPAVNAGSNPAASGSDQRGSGFLRNFGGGVDIGAIESRAIIVTNTNDSGTGSLRQGIIDANAESGNDTILFDPTVFLTAKTITLTNGEITTASTLTITGPAAGVTISGNSLSRVFNATGTATDTLALSNLTLTGGKATTGGAILANGMTVDVKNVVFTGNTATAGPGGAIAVGNDGGLLGDFCTFQNNSANSVGGAFAIQGNTDNGGVILQHSVLTGNSAGISGGAAYIESIVQILDCNIVGNTSASGGAVHINEAYASIIQGCVVVNSTLVNNTATAGDGGAVLITNSPGKVFSLGNATMTGNSAAGKGGGIANGTSGVLVSSSIVFGNSASSGSQVFTTSTLTADTSLIGSTSGAASFSGDVFTSSHVGVDPLLGPLQDNGGLGLTRMPADSSPALSAGSTNVYTGSTDQRGDGYPRVRGAAIEIGALELPLLIVTNTNNSGAGSLRQAVLDANAVPGAETITFDPVVFSTAKTITLTGGELAITDSVTILGPTAGVTVSGNTAGRVFNIDGSGTLTVAISDVSFTAGSVGGGQFGGAVRIADETVLISRSTLSGNIAAAGGGAIHLISGKLTIEASTLSGNMASAGGAIEVDGTAQLTLRNSTLSGNSVSGSYGGAILTGTGSAVAIAIQNCTITANTANAMGGAIRITSAGSTLTINSSIVSGNVAPTDSDINTSIVFANNSAFGANNNFAISGSNNLPNGTNLKLGNLANNGGLTQTHLPATDSPLINAGSNSANLSTDQRGSLRVIGGQAEIGAVEVQNLIVFNTNDSGVGSLRQAIIDANTLPGTNSISFDPTAFAVAKTIAITSGEIPVTESVTIVGPFAGATLDANFTSRILNIAASAPATVTISDLSFTRGNSSPGPILDPGGAIKLDDESLVLTRCSFVNNSSQRGGAVGSNAGASLSATDCKFSQNFGAIGGAILIDGVNPLNGSVNLLRCTVADNTGGFDAGAIFTDGALTLESSTVSGNSAGTTSLTGGGAIYLVGNFGAPASIIRNSTISGNTATASSNGGAIFLQTFTGSLTIQNSTITENSAGSKGGGIFVASGSGAVTITSSIVSGNSSPVGPDFSSSGIVTATASLIGSKTGVTTFTGDAFTNLNIGADPQLGALANNGGNTLTHLPGGNSPAINHGSNPAALTFDQRGSGFSRNFGGGVDIGAVETRTFLVTNTNDSGAGSLRQAILDSNSVAGTDIIAFEATAFSTAKTIALSTGQMSILGNLEIQGPIAGVTLNALGSSRHFNLGNSLSLVGSNLKLINGSDASTLGGSAISSTGKSIILTNCTIANNTASGPGGGAIQHDLNSAELTLIDCTISNNSSLADGGAIALDNINHSLTIVGSTLFANTSGKGSGGAVRLVGNLVLRNSTLSANSAFGSGGAISIMNGNAIVRNSTITSNAASSSGGGLHRNNSIVPILIDSSIIFGNTANTGGDLTGSDFIVNTSLIGSKSGTSAFTGDAFTNASLGLDPRLGPLSSNGGPTLTRLPLNTSPAINTGSNPDNLTTDQRGAGFPRVVGTAIDIGAVEFTGTGYSVNNNAVQRSRITTVTVHVSTPVNAATLAAPVAITLTRTTATSQGSVGTVVQTGATGANGRIVVSPATGFVNSVTLTFENANSAAVTAGVESGSLADGRWQLNIPSLGFTSTLAESSLRRLFGDVDNNGTVDASDLASLGTQFGQTVVNSSFDYDSNGFVDASDLAAFGGRFGFTL